MRRIDFPEVAVAIDDGWIGRPPSEQLGDDEAVVRDTSCFDDGYTGDQRRRHIGDDVEDVVLAGRREDTLIEPEGLESGDEVRVDC